MRHGAGVKRALMLVGMGVIVSACGTIKVPSKPQNTQSTSEGCPGGDGGFCVAAPSVVGNSYSLNTFYASFIPPNRNIVETLVFGRDGTAIYRKNVIDGEMITVTEKTIGYTQDQSCLWIGRFESNQSDLMPFQVTGDGMRIIDSTTKAVFKKDIVNVQE